VHGFSGGSFGSSTSMMMMPTTTSGLPPTAWLPHGAGCACPTCRVPPPPSHMHVPSHHATAMSYHQMAHAEAERRMLLAQHQMHQHDQALAAAQRQAEWQRHQAMLDAHALAHAYALRQTAAAAAGRDERLPPHTPAPALSAPVSPHKLHHPGASGGAPTDPSAFDRSRLDFSGRW